MVSKRTSWQETKPNLNGASRELMPSQSIHNLHNASCKTQLNKVPATIYNSMRVREKERNSFNC